MPLLLTAERSELAQAAALVALPLTAGAVLLQRWLQWRRLPPGPPGLPLVGCPRMMDQSRLHAAIHSASRQYGDIVSFRMGRQTVVAVTSYEMISEMLADDTFAGRPRIPIVKRVTEDCGIIFAEGDSWQRHRRLSLKVLRDFGFARETSVAMVDNALDAAFDEMDALCRRGQQQLLDTLLATSNSVIAQLTFGQVFTNADADYVAFCQSVKSVMQGQTLDVTKLYPSIDYLLRLLPMPRGLASLVDVMQNFIKGQIRRREQVMADEDCEPECLCDVYVQEKRRAERGGDFETFKEMQVVRVCMELFLAGTDTTARSLEWLLLFMALNPDIQRKVQVELDSVVGESRRPRMSDKTSLHYTSAVIDETYRKVSLLAVGGQHRAVKDAYFRGHLVPKEAIILPCVYSVHHDERLWSRPHEFRPEHFLDDSGKYKSSPHCVPFLIGKRACLGESLARMEVFLVFSSLMQRYWLAPSADSRRRKAEILEGNFGLVALPGSYGVTLSRR